MSSVSSAPEILPLPPFGLQDALGRRVFIRPAGADTDALVAFYERFDPADRAQGLPPTGSARIRPWLAVLAEGPGVVAWHEDHVVGHAALVPDGRGAHELVVFVLQGYRGTGIGTALVRALLGLGRARGRERCEERLLLGVRALGEEGGRDGVALGGRQILRRLRHVGEVRIGGIGAGDRGLFPGDRPALEADASRQGGRRQHLRLQRWGRGFAGAVDRGRDGLALPPASHSERL